MKAVRLVCGHVRGALTLSGGKGYWCIRCGMLQPLDRQVTPEEWERDTDPYVAVSRGAGAVHYHLLRPDGRTLCGNLPPTARTDLRMEIPRSLAEQDWYPCAWCHRRGATDTTGIHKYAMAAVSAEDTPEARAEKTKET